MTDLTPRWISQGDFQGENKRESRSGCRFRCEKRHESPDVMGWSGFSMSLAHPFDPLCLSRTKTQSNAMMSSQPLSWEQKLCVAQEQQNNLCVALTPQHWVQLFPRGRVTALVHKPLIHSSVLYLLPPTAVIQASGKPRFYLFIYFFVTWLIFYSGGIRLCRLQSHRRIHKFTKCIFMMLSNKGQIWNSYLWDFCPVNRRRVFFDFWEETKSFLKLSCRFLIRLYIRFNVALFLDLGFARHRSSEFLSACNNA